jgi:hypothetical protein
MNTFPVLLDTVLMVKRYALPLVPRKLCKTVVEFYKLSSKLNSQLFAKQPELTVYWLHAL